MDTKTKAALKKMVAAGSSIRKSPADELLRVVIPSGNTYHILYISHDQILCFFNLFFSILFLNVLV